MNHRNPARTFHATYPAPVVNDQPMPPIDGVHPSIELPDTGDTFDFTTGECQVARVINGVHYDTRQSALVASVGILDIAKGYTLKRIYLTRDGFWFVLRLELWNTFGLWDDDLIWPMPVDATLDIVRALVPDKDCRRFLLEWYCGGWMPPDDAGARHWATHSLSGQDRETVMQAIASLPPER